MEPPTNETVTSLSEELNISISTLYQWIRTKNKTSDNYKTNSKWSSEDKFQVVLETSIFTEEELVAYCGKKGFYVDEIKGWKKQCLKANQAALEDPQKLKEILKK